MSAFVKWFKIIRPQTLFAALCPVVAGLLIAAREKGLDGIVAAVTVLSALSLQVFCNLVNDYYDFVRGADKKGRQGNARALAEGTVGVKEIRRAIFITLAFVLFTGAFLIFKGGLPIILIGISSILFGYLYTATSHSLAYLGIADLFVFVYFGLLAVGGTVYLQTGCFSAQSLLTGAVCGSISTCVLIINNIRDRADDKAVNKKTFVVRFGLKAGYGEMLFFILLALTCILWCYSLSWNSLMVLPLAALFAMTLKSDGSQYNRCLLFAGLNNLIFVILTAIALFM